MKSKSFFDSIYKYEEEINAYLIEVSLDSYDEVYDDWDPSPFKRRDIEDEFNDYIYNSSEDIPLNYNIGIILHLPICKKDLKKEGMLVSALRSYYTYEVERVNKKKRNLLKRTVSYLFMSIFLLSAGYFFVSESEMVILNVLHEGILIGGWVFLWEFFTNIFITLRDMQTEYRMLDRILCSMIKFVYK